MTIVSVLLTMLFPIIMLPINIALFSTDKKHGTLYAFLIAFAMAALAFNFRPYSYQNTDILRHFNSMKAAKLLTFSEAADTNTFSGLSGYFLLLKLFSYAENQYLLPAFVTLIGYFLCIFVINKIDIKESNGISFLTVYLFMSCISFLGFCSGIRQYLTFAIFVFVFYLETVKKKFRLGAWIVYFLLLTLHTSAGFLIILRVIAGFFSGFRHTKVLAVCILLWSFTQKSIVGFLERNFSGSSIVEKIVEYSGYYKENGSEFIPYAYIWCFALLVFCTGVVIYLIKNFNKEDGIPEKYLYLAISACMFTFGGFTSYDIFSRFSIFCFMLILPMFPLFFKKLLPGTRSIYFGGLLLFSTLVLIYNINQYATFHFESILKILFTNIVTFMGAI